LKEDVLSVSEEGGQGGGLEGGDNCWCLRAMAGGRDLKEERRLGSLGKRDTRMLRGEWKRHCVDSRGMGGFRKTFGGGGWEVNREVGRPPSFTIRGPRGEMKRRGNSPRKNEGNGCTIFESCPSP